MIATDINTVFAFTVTDMNHNVIVTKGQRFKATSTDFNAHIRCPPVHRRKLPFAHVNLNVT
ncbi:Uncharacterised protein [Vibrio cholerae]|nr:Uncharacterised protein [Vibrio cholerae]